MPDDAWPASLRRRRLDLGLSQTALVRAAGGALNQSEVSRLERGVVHPTREMGLERFFAYLSALAWTPEEFERATGLELPFPLPSAPAARPALPAAATRASPPPEGGAMEGEAMAAFGRLEVHPDWLALPVLGTVSAGSVDDAPAAAGDAEDPEVAYVPRERLRARGSDPEHVRVYLVNGDCMISAEAQRVQKNIAPGDFVAVDVRRPPQPGDVVVAWWPAEEKMVVKRYRVEGRDIVLYPANPGHPNLVLGDEADVYVLGPVVWRGG